MPYFKQAYALAITVGMLTVSCSPPTTAAPTAAGATHVVPANPGPAVKHMTFSSAYEPNMRPTVSSTNRPAALLVHTGLTMPDAQRVREARLAEAVPTLGNGLWKIFPDGRMETTWRLRPGARWHDGVPLTTEDLLFSLQVGRDREMTGFNLQSYASIEDVKATDDRTLTITWKEPYIDADGLLDARDGLLLPKHLLDDASRGDKAGFLDLSYWSSEFVGAGPYRIREWAPGGTLQLEANDDYVLGRPKIDRIDVQFIPDQNTVGANVLAGTVDLATNLGVDLGIQLRDQWHGGSVSFSLASDTQIAVFPQLLDPRPSVVADLPFRRALAHAIDRQAIVDTLVGGVSPVAHTFLNPNQAAYRDIEATVPHYDYDPRQAAEMLDALGLRKNADGAYVDGAGQPIELEVRTGPTDTAFKPASVVADSWHRLGLGTTLQRASAQQFQDPEYNGTFPAFYVVGINNDVGGLRFLHSSQTRLPSNNFRVSGGSSNRSRYMNAEFDILLEMYFKTIPAPERTQVLGEIIRQVADQLTMLGLFYAPISAASSDRLLNVSSEWPGQYITWNSHEWDLKPS